MNSFRLISNAFMSAALKAICPLDDATATDEIPPFSPVVILSTANALLGVDAGNTKCFEAASISDLGMPASCECDMLISSFGNSYGWTTFRGREVLHPHSMSTEQPIALTSN